MMFLVTALYGDGSTKTHLAADAVEALKWHEALVPDAWEVVVNRLSRPLAIEDGRRDE